MNNTLTINSCKTCIHQSSLCSSCVGCPHHSLLDESIMGLIQDNDRKQAAHKIWNDTHPSLSDIWPGSK